ncbi:filamentous hemagglutinin N-terminal domain-containing protein [Pigmentiphaga kullae]|uniref:Filamentous hemagglutinin family protein n=1 Tax=Pigmentiphaga kullae TaxID=151784 RepID=A0A4Q7NLV7_9BURK|nr:filamentous hemagglutinin N-terminal domain-containing protein [Pigmentiphaga kullae]RZS85928.1 filamentous hemagglutinin family protein [Pigmentiphaga kullae]
MSAASRSSRKARGPAFPAPEARWNPRPLALALALVGTSAGAQMPTGFNPVQGSVLAPVTSGNTMSIQQQSDRAIIEWGTFSIGAGNAVRFLQPGASSIALNRVLGGDLSRISGELSANGRIFLINPAGVLFGQGSKVETGGLVASTLNISNADFMAGRFRFERDDANNASVTNLGTLTAPGSTIALMAATVVNGGEGKIVADGGTVGLVSARQVTLDFQGDGLTTFRFAPDAGASMAAVSNESGAVLQANGGRVAVLADSTQVAQRVVNQQGTIRAQSLTARNGEIILGASGQADVTVGGTLDASGAAGTSGGTIRVEAGGIRTGSARLDASGDGGGGGIELEGRRAITMDASSSLHADALASGHGGTIDIDAPGLHAAGIMTANAAGNGAGGAVTTSGGVVEVGAAHVSAAGAGSGANGKWTIASQGDVTVGAAPAARPATEVSAADGDSRVSGGAVGEALGNRTDVTVAATGFALDGGRGQSGNVVFDGDASVVKTQGGTSTLRVDAMRNIDMGNGSRIESQAGALNVEFNADSSGKAAMRRLEGASDFAEESGGSIDLEGATIATRGGDLRLFGQSDVAGGKAIGGTSFVNGRAQTRRTGIFVGWSDVSLCADDACAAGGSLAAAGTGITTVDATSTRGVEGGEGVAFSGTGVAAGGDISITGRGGVAAAGVRIDGRREGGTQHPMSAGGDITIVGTAADATLANNLPVDTAEAGVAIRNTTLSAGGDVTIDGKGSNLDALTRSPDIFGVLGYDIIEAIDGVHMLDTRVLAGPRRDILITGAAGGDGLIIDSGSGSTYSAIAARGVRIEKSVEALEAPGGTAPDIATDGGRIRIAGRDSDIWLAGEPTKVGATLQVDAGSADGRGGSVEVTGRNVGVLGATALLADGATGGGEVTVQAEAVAAVDDFARVQANSTGANGDGGKLLLTGQDGLRVHGSLQARGTGAGNGGRIETSGGGVDASGVRINAGTGTGAAGNWIVDPYDVRIVHGVGPGAPVDSPFEAVADTTIQDSSINTALDAGTSVRIGTGAGSGTGGDITIASGVDIRRTTGAAPLEFALDAYRGIQGDSFSIVSEAGALDLAFNSNASGTLSGDQSIAFQNATLTTNGGSVSLYGQSDPVAGSASSNRGPAIRLVDSFIDTRVGQSDAGAGGNVVLRGAGDGVTSVDIQGGRIDAATGSVTVRGVSSNYGEGVQITSGGSDDASITTTAGNISIVGIGGSDSSAGAEGVRLEGAHVQSASGDVDVRGLAQGAGTTAAGVILEGSSLVAQAGRVRVAGQSEGSGLGIDLQGGSSSLSSHAIDGQQGVVLRADNDGSADAIALEASVRSGVSINLRPGGVDAAGNATDHAATRISVGGAGGNGFSLSDADMGNLDAPNLIIGSNTHAADISVDGAVATAGNLTLQNEGGGAIAMGGGVTAATLALLAGGNVTQSPTAAIAANALTARSATGDVVLTHPGNAVATVSGGAAGDFRYVDADGITIGSVSALGMDAATNAVQNRTQDGISADRAIVQARSGNVTTNAAITAPTAITLQADAGAIQLNRTLDSGSVALLASGAIGQQAGAAITAGTLVARSTGAGVTLTDAGNRAGILAGGAATDFRYADADGLTLGNASVVGHDAAGNVQTVAVSGVSAGTAQIAARKGDLDVAAAVSAADLLSLQADTGAIGVGAAVQGRTVALLASGDITQAATGAIAGDALLARSTAGDVLLAAGNNDVRTLAASAAGDLRYRGSGDLAVATVTAGALDAVGAPQAVAASGLTATDAIVQATTGNLSVQAASNASNGLTLQADAGSVQVGQSLQAGTVALLARGDIGQQAGAGITADTLAVWSTAGAVTLTAAGNDAGVFAGSAATELRYADANALTVGEAIVATQDAAGGLSSSTVAGAQAGTVRLAARTGNLTVASGVTATDAASLQADAGAVAVNAAVRARTVALLATGDVTESTSGGIAADALLARSTGGDVLLENGGNDVRALAGSAAGSLGYRGAGDLAVTAVAASMLDAAGAPQAASASGVTAQDASVRVTSGNLSIAAASAAAGGLSLQADTGNVALGQSVQAATVALLAGGDIGQSASGTITADGLAARSTGGSVGLDQASNRVGTVAGGARDAFAYTDADALRIGEVTLPTLGSGEGVLAGAERGIAAASSVVRTQSGDLTLDADVTGGTADLVAAARFQNPDGARIDTSGRWRVWADTWEGETRGGMAGSGTLPNLYGRAYGASIADADNHFIYRQQPTVTVTLDSAARPAGIGNPALGYTLDGLILGDTGAGISGTAGSAANASSPAGTYAVTAATPFVSAEGYLINVVPGVLTVNSYTLPSVDLQREIPTTYLYDRNLAPVAMCFATGPIAGDRVEQAGDVLAREWSRVRTRPNLSNCVSTDRRNACSDF